VKEAKSFGLDPLSSSPNPSFLVAFFLRSWITQQTSRFPATSPERAVRPMNAMADKQNEQPDLPEKNNA